MQTIVPSLLLAFVLLVAGCAGPSTKTEPTPSASTPPAAAPAAQPAPAAAPPVQLPAASARKVVLVMTGPKNVVEAKDWPDFKREWRDNFAEYAKAANINFSAADAPPAPAAEDGTLLMVEVTDYRMIGIGTRIFLGIMTGNAYIDAKVRFTNLRNGAVFGEQQFQTTSSAWSGIFAKVTPQQVDAIGAAIFDQLKAAK